MQEGGTLLKREEKHHIEPKMLGAYLGALVIIILGLYMFFKYEDELQTVSTLSDTYTVQETGFEVPGTFPLSLVNGPNLTLESGSHFGNKGDSIEKYVYTVTASGLREDIFAKALFDLSREGFDVLEEDMISGRIIAARDSDFLEYVILDIGEKEFFINILYQIIIGKSGELK